MVTPSIKQISNLKITNFFLKKWEFIVAIKSQRYLATFCPTSKLHIDDITIKANGPLTTYNLFGVTYGILWQWKSF